MKTILITGCSSGFGLEIARHFLERDWKVIATMRTPREDVLPASENLRVFPWMSARQRASARLLKLPGQLTRWSIMRGLAC